MRRLLTIVVVTVLAAGSWLGWAVFTPVTPAQQTFVLLRPGCSTRKIAADLKSAGVVRSESAFLIWHYFHRKHSLKAGEYRFEKPGAIADIHDRLTHGDIYVYTVVIPEGYTMFDIAQAIEQVGLGTQADFLRAAHENLDLISDLAPDGRTLEGYLFPDTYEFTRTQSMREIVTVMVRHFRQVAGAIGLTSDIHPTVIMASIVEKETAVPEERPMVAGVYYNRLTKRMALDADPSVIYAELLAGSYQKALHHADLQVSSPYNTYRYPGLPPGPIGNPGKSSLLAAMHPVSSEYLYFVSDGNGHHRFARSLEEHNRNVVAFRHTVRGQ